MYRSLLLISILICPLFLVPLQASRQTVDLHASVDTVVLDALWNDHVSPRLSLGANLGDGVVVELPMACTFDRSGGGEILLDISLRLLVHPWQSGFFMGFSLTQVFLFLGPFVPQDSIHYLNEFTVGYTWEFLSRWFIRPSVIYRDPSDSFVDDFAYIEGLVPSFGKVRFCVEIGWLFASIVP